MKLTFLGANRQVTGSRYCLQANGQTLLIDCGMFQERQYLDRNWQRSPIAASDIDALILTHAHIDHSGLIPRLVREGFSGPIYCTHATVPLVDVLLRDAADIQVEETAYKQHRHAKEGRRSKYPYAPLFGPEDVKTCLPLLRGVGYGKPVTLGEQLSVRFFDAGHILGSAMLEFTFNDGAPARRLLFSGDIGQWDKPLLRDPTLFEEADFVVMESTYGDRLHQESGHIESELADVINATVERGGNVVIPTFAVERAQELMYYLGRLIHGNRIPRLKVFLDSPMAVGVTEAFRRFQECLDAETLEMIQSKKLPFSFPGLEMVRSAEDSKAINTLREPCIIMASSGMCTAGRIKFHLRMNIERSESTILFVGYQSQGTLGRQILERPAQVRIHGKLHRVRARIVQLHGLSGHADQAGLLRWIGNLRQPPQQVFLTHGEGSVSLGFADLVREKRQCPVAVPSYLESVEL